MGFAFHVDGSGARVRVTAHGVRVLNAQAVPRSRPRSCPSGPSSAQLERVRRAAELAPHATERSARLAELHELYRRSVSVHLQEFPEACPPHVPSPPSLGAAWATAAVEAFHLRGVGPFARAELAAARHRVGRDASVYLAAERARLARVHDELTEQASSWWRALLTNDERTVCAAVNAALSDVDPAVDPSVDPAANARDVAGGCAVGVRHGVLSAVLRQRDIGAFPHQAPGVSSAGRPTLATLTTRERIRWWLEVMGSQLIATVKAALAAAPGLHAVDLAVLTCLPDTRRPGVVACGRWTRRAVVAPSLRDADDPLRFLAVGEDVTCAVSGFPPRVGAVDLQRVPGLQDLVDAVVVDGLDGHADRRPAPVPDPYAIVPFAQWLTERSATRVH